MVIALLLGLLGSLGHCVGMCSLMTVMLTRQGGGAGPWILFAHLGRISSYGLLGVIAGAIGSQAAGVGQHTAHGQHVNSADSGLLMLVQSGFALIVAGGALYMMFSLLGLVRSPEILLAGITRRWRQTFQARIPLAQTGLRRGIGLYAAGMLWGLLPCGLVLTALLPAVAAGSPWRGGATMLAFGLGTIPALLGVGWLFGRETRRPPRWSRYGVAGLSGLFGLQMALRGIAAWGWIGHLEIGRVMLW